MVSVSMGHVSLLSSPEARLCLGLQNHWSSSQWNPQQRQGWDGLHLPSPHLCPSSVQLGFSSKRGNPRLAHHIIPGRSIQNQLSSTFPLPANLSPPLQFT